MGYFEIFFTGIGLSMDAFAVSVCKGIGMREINKGYIFLIAFFFGGFQMLMPLVGYLLGSQFVEYIQEFDHWISFALLTFIGGKMCFESTKSENEEVDTENFNIKELFLLAVATSIDALAVGVAFAFYDGINLPSSLAIIGTVTFFICSCGVVVGNKFGSRFKAKAELFGGLVLIGIGIKLLIEGLFFS